MLISSFLPPYIYIYIYTQIYTHIHNYTPTPTHTSLHTYDSALLWSCAQDQDMKRTRLQAFQLCVTQPSVAILEERREMDAAGALLEPICLYLSNFAFKLHQKIGWYKGGSERN